VAHEERNLPRDLFIHQVLQWPVARGLNNISGNQTFGVTSGTLDCDQSTELVSVKEVQQYISANMDAIAYDVASGEGQSLHALADLMRLPSENRSDVYARWQQGFDGIFSHDNVTADEVATKLAKLI
ncbi:MAG: DUF3015 family protein, partial [Verrucomicrobia bacterium]|nr:DUF3015 family protein [Verrucomicrobiota bacterium]